MFGVIFGIFVDTVFFFYFESEREAEVGTGIGTVWILFVCYRGGGYFFFYRLDF